jgi:predicted Zn-dependent peptidase
VIDYRNDFYTADNIVISIAGNVDVDKTEKWVEKYFVNNFSNKKRVKSQVKNDFIGNKLLKYKHIEQAHVGIAIPAFSLKDEKRDALNVASIIFGGGMSSRLFQKIREDMGLAYSVYSYMSAYEDCGILEIYAGVNPDSRDKAAEKIVEEIKRFRDDGITDSEFMRGREQIKSAFIMGQESTSSQMLLFGKQMTYFGEEFNVKEKIKTFDQMTKADVENVIREVFDETKMATATVGPKRKPLTI